MDSFSNNDLSLKETITLKRGTCPDCGKNVKDGPEAPGFKNVICDGCQMRFNIPNTNGIPGERIGKNDQG